MAYKGEVDYYRFSPHFARWELTGPLKTAWTTSVWLYGMTEEEGIKTIGNAKDVVVIEYNSPKEGK